MRVEYRREGDKLALFLGGEIDHHGAQGALAAVNTIIDAEHPQSVVLDFSRVTFTDSSGIAVVLNCERRMKSTGGTLKVRGLNPQARRVLSAAGIKE